MKRCVVSFLFLLLPQVANAHSFMPENDLYLEDNPTNRTVEYEMFHRVIDEAERIYAPIMESHGARLVIKRKWRNPTVNAFALQRGRNWEVNMFGGLARRPEVTADGFALVVCHELGHHLAGFPFVQRWAANEGQSDYFATQSCARLLWQEQTEQNAAFRTVISETPKALCDAKWTTEDEQNLCYRTMMAGHSLASLLGAAGGGVPSFDTPDGSIVESTNNKHPRAQCRLDTYMAGALCEKSFDETLIPGKSMGNQNGPEAEREAADNSCARVDGYDVHETRPLCWFAPGL